MIFNAALFEEHIHRLCHDTLASFRAACRFYALFQVIYLTIAILELFCFASFFPFFTQSTLLAFSLAALFLTCFSYFVLLFYFQAKKPQQLLKLRNEYIDTVRQLLPFRRGDPELHLSIAHAIYRLLSHFDDDMHLNYYRFPLIGNLFHPIIEKFSRLAHWKDELTFKEILLFVCINEHVELVKEEPTDLEAHASLAHAYLVLSYIYTDPRILHPEKNIQWVASDYAGQEMRQKFKRAKQRAIEEYKVLDHFSPNDPWIYSKLASIYRDLEMPKEEIAAYEAILETSPHQKDIILRLGILYFQEGSHARGLQLYEALKKSHRTEAEELLTHYDAHFTEEYISLSH